MINRDEYVQKLKDQLDQWNAEAKKWEAKSQSAQSTMKAEYDKQLKALHSRRDEAMNQLKMLQGADQAWKNMHEAFTKAKSHFDKK